MAPLTRGRAGEERTPNEIMLIYYTQRAGAAMILTEATAISEQGYGWFHSPGIYTDGQTEAWKKITDAVHANGSYIFLQLWHMGRQSHSTYQPGKALPVSSSAIAVGEGKTTGADGQKYDYEVPRPLETSEIPDLIEQYRQAAENAKKAGFDGVEVHAANGYIIDQFLQTCSNTRTDQYGGSVENRYRLLGEVVEAVKTVWPADRIGVRVSPNGMYGGMGSEDNFSTFSYVAKQLQPHGLAYLHIMDGLGFGYHKKDRVVTPYDLKKLFEGPIISNVGHTRDTGDGAVRSGAVDMVAYGRPFISNPDLPVRFEKNLPLAADAPFPTWYHGEEKGYIDWPTAETNGV